jgi:WD40 repeat protein/serine/threonine protein kinase
MEEGDGPMSAHPVHPDEPESLSVLQEIEDACDDFEIAWRADQKPRIEDYVARASERVRIDLLRELLRVEIACRQERDETILSQDYTPRFPEHVSLIETLLAVGSSADLSDELTQAGRYRLEGRIGRGGMGDVYRAHDPDFHRPLAVKVLKEEFKDRPDMVARFLEEAQITGQLQHPGVPPVHEIGRLPDGRPFLAMKLIEGRTLAELLAERRLGESGTLPSAVESPNPGANVPVSRNDLPRFLAISEQICQTLAYAHSRRIIHRDLKPLNIMVGAFGEVQVVDWGLAKNLASADEPKVPAINTNGKTSTPLLLETILNPTQQGHVMGTVAYMPPEQARGEVDRLDERSDVFSLGAMLCEFLTGEPPYGQPTEGKLWERAKNGDLNDAFSRLEASGADEELIALAMQCLTAEPALRPPNAGNVARALAAYEAEVQERLRQAELERTEAHVRAKESRKRRRVAVALGSLVLLVLIVGIVATLSQYQRRVEQRDHLDKEIGLKKIALTEARENLYAIHMNIVQKEYEANNFVQARELLDNWVPKNKEDKDLRGFEWHYWNRLVPQEGLTFTGHTGWVLSVAFSSDGRRLASGSRDNTVKLWDAARGMELQTLKGHMTAVTSVAFSPDGHRLASCSDDGTVKLWDVASGMELQTLKGHMNTVTSVAFSPDGHRLASCSDDGTVKLWDVASGKEMRTLKKDYVSSVAFSPDGRRLASGNGASVTLWDVASGKELRTRGHTGGGQRNMVTSVAFSPEGRHLASGSDDMTIKLWDPATGKEVRTLTGHTDGVRSIAFSPEGRRLASRSYDGTIKVWDVSSGEELTTLKGHAGNSLAFSPDGRRLASGNSTTIKGWNVASCQEPFVLTGHWDKVLSVAFSPDGHRLAIGSCDQTVKLWDVSSGQELLDFQAHMGLVTSVAFSPDGCLASGSMDQTVKLWDVASSRELRTLRGHTASVSSVALNRDGRRLASGSNDGTVKLWDIAIAKEPCTLQGHTDAVTSVAFSPDGHRLASGSRDKTLRLWDVRSGQEVLAFQGHMGLVTSVAFSPDGCLASGSDDKTVKLWDVASSQELRTLRGHTASVSSVAFSPDGRRLASGSDDGTVKLWDVSSGQELLTLKGGQGHRVMGVAFSPDGRRLASGSDDGTVKLWETLVSIEERSQRYVVRRVQDLFAEFVLRDEVLGALSRDASLGDGEREFAAQVARNHSEGSSQALNELAWQVVRERDCDLQSYARALRQAEAAARAKPMYSYSLSTLGIAQYRVGQYAAALATLTKSDHLHTIALNRPLSADLAFLAMAQHQLGAKAKAKATLARLREAMKKPRWTRDLDAQGFLGEAETLINGGQRGQD